MPKESQTIERLVFPNLEIRLRHEYTPAHQYGATTDARFLVESVTSAGLHCVTTVEEFCQLLRSLDPALLTHELAASAARIASVLLDIGRVVTPNPLYDFIELQFVVRLVEQAPRLEQGHLSFLAVEVDGAGKAVVHSVSACLLSKLHRLHPSLPQIRCTTGCPIEIRRVETRGVSGSGGVQR